MSFLSTDQLIIKGEKEDVNQISLPSYLEVKVNDTILNINMQSMVNLKKLGQGSFSNVQLMRYNKENINFAVKMSDKLNTVATNAILTDIKIGQSVSSRFKIHYYGAIQDISSIWIIMEAMEMSVKDFYLKCLVNDEDFRLPSIIIGYFAFCSVCGLEDLHSKNIMHRDIKPSNMLIDKCGTFKLCDFGISGIMKDSLAQSAVGTNAYCAPEKINPETCKEPYTIKADIWSLGLSIMEVVIMRYPFWKATSMVSQLSAIVEGPVPRISDSSPYINDLDMIEFFDSTLMKSANKRKTYKELRTIKFIRQFDDISVFNTAKDMLAQLILKLS